MLDYLRLSAEALALTVGVEAGVAWLFGLRTRRAQVTVALINVVTNPLLFYLAAVNNSYQLVTPALFLTLGLETAVVIAEWRLLVWRLGAGWRRMLLLSLAMNSCSYLAGLLILK